MPTTGTVNANDVLLYVDGVAVGCLTNVSFAGTNEEIDVTCKDDNGSRKTLAGQQNSTVSFTGYTKMDVAAQFPLLITAWGAKTNHTYKLSTEVTGDVYIEDSGFLSAFNWDNGVNAGSEFSGTFSPGSASTGVIIDTVS